LHWWFIISAQLNIPISPLRNAVPAKSRLENRVTKLLAAGADVLSAVKGASEAELLRARRAITSIGWRGEVVFDAAMVNVGYAKRGRGNVDVDCVGVHAAIRKQAKLTRLSVSTIKTNVKIFNTFFKNGLSIYPNLDEKGFFQAALRAPNPISAIKYFDRMVSNNSNFSFTEASNWAERKRRKRLPKNPTVSAANTSLAEHIVWAKKEIFRIKSVCPDRKFVDRFYTPLLEELDDHLVFMAEKNAEDICRLAWDRGYHREAQISEATGLNRKTVSSAMLRLSEQEEFWAVEEITHGRHDQRWQKAGVPLGSNYAAPIQQQAKTW
jgi:hypothetical protein